LSAATRYWRRSEADGGDCRGQGAEIELQRQFRRLRLQRHQRRDHERRQKFHGNVYEYFRNDKLDARNFFANELQIIRLNNFGYTFSGLFIFRENTTTRARRISSQLVPGTGDPLNGIITPQNLKGLDDLGRDLKGSVNDSGMYIPLYADRGGVNRLRSAGGAETADFPSQFLRDKGTAKPQNK
jgi:hypothetical protein